MAFRWNEWNLEHIARHGVRPDGSGDTQTSANAERQRRSGSMPTRRASWRLPSRAASLARELQVIPPRFGLFNDLDGHIGLRKIQVFLMDRRGLILTRCHDGHLVPADRRAF